MNIKASQTSLTDNFASTIVAGEQARKALVDQPREKESDGANRKVFAGTVKKLVKNMQDLTMDALTTINVLKDSLSSKPYLKPLVEIVEQQYKCFVVAREDMVQLQCTLPTMDATAIAAAGDTLVKCQAHYDAFKVGALKEAQSMLSERLCEGLSLLGE